MEDVNKIFKDFPEGIECNELKSQRIRGRDEERERTLKIVDEQISLANALDNDIEWKYPILIILESIEEDIKKESANK